MRRSVKPAPQAERERRLGLAARHRKDAGAHDLGDEGGGIGRERDQQRDEFRDQPDAADEIEAAQFRQLETDRETQQHEDDKRQPDDQAEPLQSTGNWLAGADPADGFAQMRSTIVPRSRRAATAASTTIAGSLPEDRGAAR